MRTARVFVYGTLQRAYGIRYYEDLWLDEGEPGTVPGTIYDHGYPVAKFDETRFGAVIHGTYHTVDLDSPKWKEIEDMELRAGYEVIGVPDGVRGDALAFHYRHKPRGPKIESGDFLAYDAQRYEESS